MRNRLLIESLLYSDDVRERMHPSVESDLIENKTSFGDNPCFPVSDERNFMTKIVSERFKEVVERCRRAFDVDEINNQEIKNMMMPIMREVLTMEGKHKKTLEELAIKMVKEEFDIHDEVQFEVELSPRIELANIKETPSDDILTEFEDHEEMEYANDSVYKRRFINGMINGAAKKVNHMFHLVDDELTKLNPRLPNNYSKLMSGTDYIYFQVPDLKTSVNGGSCVVDYGNSESDNRPVIKAKAMVFPVLIHELVKGCMEVLSAVGLPTKENIAEYVVNKSDYLQAELWDLRGGPALWGKFCSMMPAEDFKLKHHVYSDLVQLEPKEFFTAMKEVLGGTKRGKEIINEILNEVKRELKEDSYRESIGDDFFGAEDLI
jgi:hypothetical protein